MNPSSTLTVSRRLLIAFGTVIGIFLAVAATSLYSSAHLAEAETWNIHTYQVLDRSNTLLNSMVNMETGTRGFLLSGEDRFLEPWKAGSQAFDQAWTEVKKLTSDNPAQQQRLDGMKARNTEFTAVVIALMQARRDVAAGTRTMQDFLVQFGQGKDKAAMDGFRALQGELDKAESDLLARRSAEAEQLRAFNVNAWWPAPCSPSGWPVRWACGSRGPSRGSSAASRTTPPRWCARSPRATSPWT